jgi:hypothetical protein
MLFQLDGSKLKVSDISRFNALTYEWIYSRADGIIQILHARS